MSSEILGNNHLYTINEIDAIIIERNNLTENSTDTFPSISDLLIFYIPGHKGFFNIYNKSSYTITLQGNSSVTLAGSYTILPNIKKDYEFVVVSETSAIITDISKVDYNEPTINIINTQNILPTSEENKITIGNSTDVNINGTLFLYDKFYTNLSVTTVTSNSNYVYTYDQLVNCNVIRNMDNDVSDTLPSALSFMNSITFCTQGTAFNCKFINSSNYNLQLNAGAGSNLVYLQNIPRYSVMNIDYVVSNLLSNELTGYCTLITGATNSSALNDTNIKDISTNNYTVSVNDSILNVIYNGNVSLTLPAASSVKRKITITDKLSTASNNNITVYTSNGDTIYGHTSILLNINDISITLVSDAVNKWTFN